MKTLRKEVIRVNKNIVGVTRWKGVKRDEENQKVRVGVGDLIWQSIPLKGRRQWSPHTQKAEATARPNIMSHSTLDRWVEIHHLDTPTASNILRSGPIISTHNSDLWNKYRVKDIPVLLLYEREKKKYLSMNAYLTYYSTQGVVVMSCFFPTPQKIGTLDSTCLS